MASAQLLPRDDEPHRRSSARLRVCIPGILILLDGTFDCALEDISQGGARVICDAPLAKGNSGVLRCQQLEAFFDVAWQAGKQYGLQFDEPASIGVIRAIRWYNDHYREQSEAELRRMVRQWVAGEIR